MQTQNFSCSDLNIGGWASSCYIVRPDYNRLATSIETYGILSPLVVHKDTNKIIDGHHRLDVAQQLGVTSVPCVVVDCDEIEAVLLHIDLNRYRGVVVAKFLSNLIGYILETGAYEYADNQQPKAHSQIDQRGLGGGTLPAALFCHPTVVHRHLCRPHP